MSVGLSHLVYVPRAAGGPHFFSWPRDGQGDRRGGFVSRLAAAGQDAVAPIVDETRTPGAVEGVAIPFDEALRMLAAVPADDVDALPASVAVWSVATKLALDLVARERIVPMIDATNAGGEARWGVSLLLSQDSERVKRLAAAFPPAAPSVMAGWVNNRRETRSRRGNEADRRRESGSVSHAKIRLLTSAATILD